MNCKRAKQELALSAGNDLDPISEQDLRRHLADCPDCYDQWNRLRASTTVLQHTAAEEIASSEPPRLWTSLSQQLPSPSPRRQVSANSLTLANAWVPLVAVASLFLAVVSIQRSMEQPANQPQTADFNTFAEGYDPVQSESNPVQGQPVSGSPSWRPVLDPASVELNYEEPIDRLDRSYDSRFSQPQRRVENGNPNPGLIK